MKAKTSTGAKAPRLLREMMTAPVVTLTAGQTASDAWALMREERVRHAVVLRGRSVIGVISDRDLGGTNGGAARRGRSVADLMQDELVLARADMPIEEAASLVDEEHIGCLPVLDGKTLVGIVTRTDLLRLLVPPKRRAIAPRRAGAADDVRPPRLTSPNVDKRA